jgi:hypothetical protein
VNSSRAWRVTVQQRYDQPADGELSFTTVIVKKS